MFSKALSTVSFTTGTGAVVVGGSLLAIVSGYILLPPGRLGPAPSMNYKPGETSCEACWVQHANRRYDVYDVRFGTLYLFMTASMNGVAESNPEILSRVFSIRLAMQMAHIVKVVNSNAQNVDKLASILEPMLEGAIKLAELSNQRNTLRELKEASTSLGGVRNLAARLIEVLSIVEPQAQKLLEEHSYEEAEEFLVALLTTGVVFSSNKARLIVFMITMAAGVLGLPSAAWLDPLFEKLPNSDLQAVMSVVSLTFGVEETNRTVKEMNARS